MGLARSHLVFTLRRLLLDQVNMADRLLCLHGEAAGDLGDALGRLSRVAVSFVASAELIRLEF